MRIVTGKTVARSEGAVLPADWCEGVTLQAEFVLGQQQYVRIRIMAGRTHPRSIRPVNAGARLRPFDRFFLTDRAQPRLLAGRHDFRIRNAVEKETQNLVARFRFTSREQENPDQDYHYPRPHGIHPRYPIGRTASPPAFCIRLSSLFCLRFRCLLGIRLRSAGG